MSDDIPFEIPSSWVWTTIEYVTYSVGSKENQIQTKEIKSEGAFPVVSQGQDLIDGYCDEYDKTISDLPLIMFGDHTRNVKIIDFQFVIGADGTKFHKVIGANTEYIYYWMQYAAHNLKNRGYARHYTLLKKFLLPLPPIAEQSRIVRKIKSVLPLIDTYGAVELVRENLNANFPSELKKSILQWAVQGKLVPQDPSDEPAEALLERIRGEKERLTREGKIKRDKNESVIFRRDNSHYEKLGEKVVCIDDKIPFEIPDNWRWASIGSVFYLQAGKNIQASDISEVSTENDFPCYGGNGIRGYVPFFNHNGDYPIIGRQGALCGCINRATGIFYATEHAVCVDTFADTDVAWACYFLTALNLNQYATATAQPGLAVSNINHVLIPVPPLAEQQRIVVKIEELMPLVKTL